MADQDASPQTDGSADDFNLRVGVVDVEQVAGGVSVNDISQYFDQRKRKIKQCPPHLYVLFKREDGRRPSWGRNKAYIENPKMLLPGLENLVSGRRVATEIVPRSHQAFHFKVAADTSDDAYFEHDVRVVFSIKNPIKFIDTTGLDAKAPETAAYVGQRFFADFMSPIIRARLDSLTKKVDSDGINVLNARPEIVDRYMFNQDYDVEGALAEIALAEDENRAPQIPAACEEKYDSQWRDFIADYGVQLERFVSSIDQSEEIAAANLQKAQARAAAERAKIDADVQLYVQQKRGEAAAAGAVSFLEQLQNTLVGLFGDTVRTPNGFRQALSALAEYKALNDPEPGQKVFISTGGGSAAPAPASTEITPELVSRLEALMDDRLDEVQEKLTQQLRQALPTRPARPAITQAEPAAAPRPQSQSQPQPQPQSQPQSVAPQAPQRPAAPAPAQPPRPAAPPPPQASPAAPRPDQPTPAQGPRPGPGQPLRPVSGFPFGTGKDGDDPERG